MFGLSSILCKVNGITLYNLSFDKSHVPQYEMTVQSLDRDLQLLENGVNDAMFEKLMVSLYCICLVLKMSKQTQYV